MVTTIDVDNGGHFIKARDRRPELHPCLSLTHLRIYELVGEPSSPRRVPGGWPELPPALEHQRPERSASKVSKFGRNLSVSSEVFHDAIESQGWGASGLGSSATGGGLRESVVVQAVAELGPGDGKDSRHAENEPPQEPPKENHRYAPRVWMIMAALCITNLLVALEGTVISTALPTIVLDLGGGQAYVWASTGYFLPNTVFQPLYGQMADIFGRRWLIIFAVGMFMVGSAISGAAPTMGALIAGRVLQGIGGGGITILVNLIVCDLAPLRERGRLMAVVFACISVGTSLGPIIGGVIVQRTTWRWVFFLNLPIGGIALILLWIFLQVGTRDRSSLCHRLKQIDYGGNAVFILAVSFILVALAYGGTQWPWGSYSTIISLVFGFYGVAVFVFYEQSNFCRVPTLPMRLFARRTSATALAITFIHSLLTLLGIYFIPVYFQAVLLASPIRSGVMMLPMVLALVPSSVISGALLSKIGRYTPFHFAGFALFTLGFGCFCTLDAHSPTGAWVMVQFVVALGSGFSLSTLLPAVQAEFSDHDTAVTTAAWAFVRQFGVVWGVSVPSAIFNAQVDRYLPGVGQRSVQEALGGGAGYEHGTKAYVLSLTGDVRDQVIRLYSDSLRVVWIFATAIAGLGFLLVFLEKEIPLRTELNTKYGLKDDPKRESKEPLVKNGEV